MRRAAALVWLLGALAATAYYARATYYPPIRTPIGIETRLFGTEAVTGHLVESPGGRWLYNLAAWSFGHAGWDSDADMFYTWPHRMARARALAARAWWPPGRGWPSAPGNLAPTRHLALAPMWNTWILSPHGLRNAVARGAFWKDDAHLIVEMYYLEDVVAIELAPRTGAWRGPIRYHWEGLVEPRRERFAPPFETAYPAAKATALAVAADPLYATTDLRQEQMQVGGGVASFVWSRYADHPRARLLAASRDSPTQLIPIARRARFLAASRDGRTVFFRRDNAVWRLDLRAPLTDLLAEASAGDAPR